MSHRNSLQGNDEFSPNIHHVLASCQENPFLSHDKPLSVNSGNKIEMLREKIMWGVATISKTISQRTRTKSTKAQPKIAITSLIEVKISKYVKKATATKHVPS